MDRPDFQAEIRELNLAYLMLAQNMLRNDRATAMFRLGMGDELADVIEALTAAKLVRMAGSQMLIPCFRFDDAQLARLMAGEGRDVVSAGLHAAILAAGMAAGGVKVEKEAGHGNGLQNRPALSRTAAALASRQAAGR